jgi:hypothetical protein
MIKMIKKTKTIIMWCCLYLICIQSVSSNDILPGTQEYEIWTEYLKRDVLSIKDIDPKCYYNNRYFNDLVKVGVPAIPFLISKVQDDHLVGHALYRIIKKDFQVKRVTKISGDVWCVPEFSDMQEIQGPPDYRVLWKRWWEEGRKETPAKFDSLYDELKNYKSSGKDDMAQENLQKIQNLGIDVLPLAMDKITEGEGDFIPVVSYLTDHDLPSTSTVTQARDWWSQRKTFWQLPPVE